MTVKLSPFFNGSQLDNNGNLLAGGKVYWYAAGTTTPQSTFTDSTGVTSQANPVILDSRGEPANPIWLTTGQMYKAVLKDSLDNLIRTIDNIQGINDVAQQAISEWALLSSSGTWTSANTFTIAADVTSILTVGRRLKIPLGTTWFGSITDAVFSGVTTITVLGDGGSTLGASNPGPLSISYGILSSVNASVPAQYVTDTTGNARYVTNSSRIGEGIWWFGATAKAGTLICNGDTIGSSASGSTHTGTAYQSLYNLLWVNGTDTTCPMLTSAGGASTRGASAAADWAANKRLKLPNLIHGGTPVMASGDLGQSTHGQVLSHAHPLDPGTYTSGGTAAIKSGGGTGGASTAYFGGTDNLAAGLFWNFCIFYADTM